MTELMRDALLWYDAGPATRALLGLTAPQIVTIRALKRHGLAVTASRWPWPIELTGYGATAATRVAERRMDERHDVLKEIADYRPDDELLRDDAYAALHAAFWHVHALAYATLPEEPQP